MNMFTLKENNIAEIRYLRVCKGSCNETTIEKLIIILKL